VSNGNEKQIRFCPYCGTRIDPSFKFCPYCGSPLPIVERAENITSAKRSAESSIEETYRPPTYRRSARPLRIFTAVAFVLWFIYVLLGIISLPALMGVFTECENDVSTILSSLQDARRIIGIVPIKIDTLDKIINALWMIRVSNYLFITIEVLVIIIVFVIIYYLMKGKADEFKISVISIFALGIVGGMVAGIIGGLGIGTLVSYLSILPEPVSNILSRYIDNLLLAQRVIESSSWYLPLSMVLNVILIVVSYLAYKEMKRPNLL